MLRLYWLGCSPVIPTVLNRDSKALPTPFFPIAVSIRANIPMGSECRPPQVQGEGAEMIRGFSKGSPDL